MVVLRDSVVVVPEEFETLDVADVVVSSDTVDVAETVSVVVLRDSVVVVPEEFEALIYR